MMLLAFGLIAATLISCLCMIFQVISLEYDIGNKLRIRLGFTGKREKYWGLVHLLNLVILIFSLYSFLFLLMSG